MKMMKNKFMSGIVTGSILGATVGMVAVNKMSPRQRRKAMKVGKKLMSNVVENIGLF